MNKIVLESICRRITRQTAALIEEINILENSPEDEAAYHIQHIIGEIAGSISRLCITYVEEDNSEEIDLMEEIAQAIRAAK